MNRREQEYAELLVAKMLKLSVIELRKDRQTDGGTDEETDVRTYDPNTIWNK